MVLAEFTISTIRHENPSTTIVLIAVAKSESVFLMPHLTNIDVIPAKNAESIAEKSHI